MAQRYALKGLTGMEDPKNCARQAIHDPDEGFIGAKVALFLGERLAVILRDEDRDIPWPGWWDFPGGGREGAETPEDVALRETLEELGIALKRSDFVWKRRAMTSTGQPTFFFVARLPAQAARRVRFGDEGQRWELWTPSEFFAHPRAIPHFKERLAAYLGSLGHHDPSSLI
ncbi:MAG: NUDIX hydrolase [Pseudomonadota bacterium]